MSWLAREAMGYDDGGIGSARTADKFLFAVVQTCVFTDVNESNVLSAGSARSQRGGPQAGAPACTVCTEIMHGEILPASCYLGGLPCILGQGGRKGHMLGQAAWLRDTAVLQALCRMSCQLWS